eukprot:6824877-Pyramimonas_sp.AAC.1
MDAPFAPRRGGQRASTVRGTSQTGSQAGWPGRPASAHCRGPATPRPWEHDTPSLEASAARMGNAVSALLACSWRTNSKAFS